jgi:hypothetical protein
VGSSIDTGRPGALLVQRDLNHGLEVKGKFSVMILG